MKLNTISSSIVFLALTLGTLTGCQRGDQTPAFSYDGKEFPGAKPWTSENFQNKADNFQFAVIGDRTGGSDPRGIFSRAIDQMNLLQPEFVINVGDLVEGYTQDKARADAMWDEVDTLLATLEMPFFFTVGNHDMGNEIMREVWVERRGKTYYHFRYRDVLFLVLNSEDPSNPIPPDIEEKTIAFKKLQQENPKAARAMLEEFMASLDSYRTPFVMTDEQIEYFRKVLENNRDVRWTFLFLHQPDWEKPGKAFLTIEEMVQDRPYTFIAGHLHYYDIQKRKGRDYITMGPAGASWHKNGNGNVDNFLWITMKDSEPEIAYLTLDGIWDRQGRDLKLKEIYNRDVK